jgi:hypothetical protein
MSEQLSPSEIAEIAREEAGRVLTERTIPEFPAYFFQGRWLVTYDWLADVQQEARQRIAGLEQRIARLERPWWRRWLSR